MKKLLAILLIFLLAMGMAACGGSDETPSGDEPATENTETDETTENEEQNGEEESEGTGNGSIGTGQTVNPDELILNEDEYSDMEAEYDFGFKVNDGFGLESMVAKVDYSDISSLAAEMEARLSAADSALGTNFAGFGEYEEDPAEEIDKLAYAIALENDDTESKYIEAGAYHLQTDNKNYQYVMVATENFYDVSSANTQSVLKTLKDGMGVEISEKTMSKAIEKAYGQAVATEDYFSLMDNEVRSGKGYKETVKVSVDAFAYEDGTIGYYVSCERERCYE